MPGCEDREAGGMMDANISPELTKKISELGDDTPSKPIYAGPFKDDGGEDTNPPFVRDLTVPELEEVIEKCVRRVLDGEDIKREFERLQAEIKK